MASNVNKALYRIIKISGTILILLLIVYGTMHAGMTAYDFGYRIFTEPAMESGFGTNITVTVDDTMEALDIANYLEEKGLIRDAELFFIQYQLSAYKGKLGSGTYTLNTTMTTKEMIIAMADKGKSDNSDDTDVTESSLEDDTEISETEE